MSNRLFTALLFAAAVLIPAPSHARSILIPPPPEEVLRAAGLALDAASLIRYLEEGIPPAHVPPPSESTLAQPFFQRRFDYYISVVSVLASSKNAAAAPVLRKLLSGSLPPVIEADLDISAASSRGWSSESPRTREDWDGRLQWEHDRLRISCALGILELTGESPVPFLDELLEKWTPVFLRELEAGTLESDLTRFYVSICESLTVQGAKTGIDATINVLGHPNGVVHGPGVSVLQQWTGQIFGPHYDDSEKTKAAEIQKWNEWWAANRDTLKPDISNIEAPLSKLTPYPAPMTLRDRVWHAREASMDYDGQYLGKQSIAWLEEHGAQSVVELREVADDENERLAIRAEALKWYVKFAPRRSYDVLSEYATRPPIEYFDPLPHEAVRLIKEYFPDKHEESLRLVIASNSSAASNAVQALPKSPENIAFLKRIFLSLSGEGRDAAANAIIGDGSPPIEVLESALLEANVFRVAHAGKAITKYGVEIRLSDEARSALGRWRSDPEFVFESMNFSAENEVTVQEFKNVLEAIRGETPQDAFVYLRAFERLHSLRKYSQDLTDHPADVDRIEIEFLRRYLRCVESYRISRGRIEPFPAYAY